MVVEHHRFVRQHHAGEQGDCGEGREQHEWRRMMQTSARPQPTQQSPTKPYAHVHSPSKAVAHPLGKISQKSMSYICALKSLNTNFSEFLPPLKLWRTVSPWLSLTQN